MGNVQRVLETTFCEAPGCPDDAAPDARFCTRHMRARVVHLDCSYWRCDLRAEPDSIFCEAHGLLEAARAQPVITPSSSIGGPTLDAGDVIPSETKEPDVSPDRSVDEPRERPQCRIEGCEYLAETWTIGNRRQGGRYDMCSLHLEELTERARETRRRNREAAQGVSPPPAREEERGAAGSPAVEGTETAPPPAETMRETIERGSRIQAEHSARARELPVIPCPRVDQHPAHAWETAEEGSPEAWCRGLNADGTAPYDPTRPSRTYAQEPAMEKMPDGRYDCICPSAESNADQCPVHDAAGRVRADVEALGETDVECTRCGAAWRDDSTLTYTGCPACATSAEPTMEDLPPPAKRCGRRSEHDAHDWIEDDDPRIGVESIYRCDGSGEEDAPTPFFRYLGPARVGVSQAGILETDGRFSYGTPDGPQRPLTWAERAAALADVGKAIDDLEFELDQARAHWRALASPE